MSSQYQQPLKFVKHKLGLVILLMFGAVITTPAQAILIGPSGGTGLAGEYAQSSDSPFSPIDFSGGYFHLENFEGLDHLGGQQFNTPGVTGSAGGPVTQTFGPNIHDSVDTDDGTIDGSGLQGESWFASGTGVTFTFDASILGALPTHAGMVWTDGGNPITFEAFDAFGVSLGMLFGNHATPGSFGGQTDEDRFYGVIEAGGISAIRFSNNAGGIELDHLQYGNTSSGGGGTPIPEPATLVLFGAGLFGIGFARRKMRI